MNLWHFTTDVEVGHCPVSPYYSFAFPVYRQFIW